MLKLGLADVIIMEEPSTRRHYWKALGQTKKDFDSARERCALDGGDVAVMETEQLWEFVKNNLGYFSNFLR